MHFKEKKSEKAKIVWGILMRAIGIIVLIIVGFNEEAFAGMRGSSPRTHTPVPKPPPVIQPVVPPPQFFNKWSITEVVNSFQGNGLEIANIKPVSEEDYSSLPVGPEQGIKFSIPSIREDAVGCILSFDDKYDLEKVKKHYQSLNKKGELYSWTFVKDNILLVLDGAIQEAKAREYERALYDLKK